MSEENRKNFEIWLIKQLVKEGIDEELIPIYLIRMKSGEYQITRTARDWSSWKRIALSNQKASNHG